MQKIKFTLILVIVTFAAISAWAVMNPPLEQAITTAGYSAVRLPAGYGCSSFSLTTYDGAAYYIASKSDGADGVLFPDDTKFSLDQKFPPSLEGTILFYAKGTTSTNLIGLFVW